MSTILLVLGGFAFICNVFVLIYGYRILQSASFIPTWKKGWCCFLVAFLLILSRRIAESIQLLCTVTPDLGVPAYLPFHLVSVVISSILVAMFIYYMSKVFMGITSLNEESRFVTLVRNLPTGIVVYSEDATIVYVNSVARDILGLSDCDKEDVTEPMLHSRMQFINEDGTDLPLCDHPVYEILRTGAPFNDRVYGTKDGKWILCNAYATNGSENQVVVVFTDISELKNAEKSVIAANEIYRHAFLSSHDAIIITNADGKIYSINRMFTLFTGYDEEVIGKTTHDIGLWRDLKDRALLLEALKKEGQVSDWDAYFVHKDGGEIHGLLSATILANSKNRILASIKAVRKREHNQRSTDKEVYDECE